MLINVWKCIQSCEGILICFKTVFSSWAMLKSHISMQIVVKPYFRQITYFLEHSRFGTMEIYEAELEVYYMQTYFKIKYRFAAFYFSSLWCTENADVNDGSNVVVKLIHLLKFSMNIGQTTESLKIVKYFTPNHFYYFYLILMTFLEH